MRQFETRRTTANGMFCLDHLAQSSRKILNAKDRANGIGLQRTSLNADSWAVQLVTKGTVNYSSSIPNE